MEIKQIKFLEVMGRENVQFVIPVYQRAYAWLEKQCEGLWRDIIRAGKTHSPHFIGTLLYIPEPHIEGENLQRYDIVDGQQRTSTLMLLLIALRSYVEEHPEAKTNVDAATIDAKYLKVKGGIGDGCKLILSRLDRDTLIALVNETDLPEMPAPRVLERLHFFENKMKDANFDVQTLWEGLKQLVLIEAELTSGDNAQYIFDSMNSKGMPLTPVDLVRNRFLIGDTHDEQARLYQDYWLPIEAMFDTEVESDTYDRTYKLNKALRAWLAVNLPGQHAHDDDETYALFKHFIEDVYEGSKEDLMTDLQGFCSMFAGTFKNPEGIGHTSYVSKDSDKWNNQIRKLGYNSRFDANGPLAV